MDVSPVIIAPLIMMVASNQKILFFIISNYYISARKDTTIFRIAQDSLKQFTIDS